MQHLFHTTRPGSPAHLCVGGRASGRRPGVEGFTLLELLVTIGIIIAVLSTVLAALSFASRRAQRANTEFLMNSIKSGLAKFKQDHGYHPPVLGVPGQLIAGTGAQLGWPATMPATVPANIGYSRDLLIPPYNQPSNGVGTLKTAHWSQQETAALQRWNSVTSLPEYLVGYGDRSADGYGTVNPQSTTQPGALERPTLGIRSPGRDGVWGAALSPLTVPELGSASLTSYYAGSTFNNSTSTLAGLYAQRNLAVPPRVQVAAALGNDVGNNTSACLQRSQPNLAGRSFGPYMEVKDETVLGGITGWTQVTDAAGNAWFEPTVVRAGEVDNFDALPKCFVDYWGKPIRYFRRGYSQLDPAVVDQTRDGSHFDLGDFIGLRPFSLPRGSDTDGVADANADTTTSRSLQLGEFALLSYGPDRQWNPFARIDPQGYNEDNIVETGP